MRRTLAVVVVVAGLVGLAVLVLREYWLDRGTEPAPAGTSEVTDSDVASSPAPEPHEQRPRARPGEAIVVELTEPPAQRYGAAEPTGADEVYAAVLASVGRREAIYDAALGRAARELAYQHSLIGGLLPTHIVEFLLRSAGAIDRSVTQGYTQTRGEGTEAIASRLEQMLQMIPADGRALRVGIGEAYVPGAPNPRYIGIMLSRRDVEISPAPRRVRRGQKWSLSGTLPPGFERPSGLLLDEDGKLQTLDVATAGRRFSLRRRAAARPGTFHVSVSAVGPHGPLPLLQVPVTVEDRLPTIFETHLPPDESGVVSIDEAEQLALRLLNEDRTRFGLSALERDRRLDDIARAHSADMRARRYFGHYSDDSGSPGDRLLAAGYRASTHAENVALGSSIFEAEVGLLHSLGHRRNILNPRFTRVGIGVSAERLDKRTVWRLTQLFARPTPRIAEVRELRRLRERITARRRGARVPPLRRDPAYDRIARAAAARASLGATDKLPEQVLEDTKALCRGCQAGFAWVSRTADLEALELPGRVVDSDFGRVGVGVVQDPDEPHGLIGVVLIFGAPR